MRVPLWKRGGTIRCYALVDDSDADLVAGSRWFFDGVYAAKKSAPHNLRMHRLVMGLEYGDPREVDHINRDKLDNRRSNLRIVDHRTNGKNVPSQGGTSRHRGVSWDKARGLWRAQARFNYRVTMLGRFADEDDAAAAVREFWAERGVVVDVPALEAES